jgi:hypothetical protein
MAGSSQRSLSDLDESRIRYAAAPYYITGIRLSDFVERPEFKFRGIRPTLDKARLLFVFELIQMHTRLGFVKGGVYEVETDRNSPWALRELRITSDQTLVYKSTLTYEGVAGNGWPRLRHIDTSRYENGHRFVHSKINVHYIGPSRRKEAEFTPEYYGLPSTIFDQISGPAPKPWWWTYGLWGGIGVVLLVIAGWLWRRTR